jgi:hypothetical protein
MSNMAVDRVVTVGRRRWRQLAYNKLRDFLRTYSAKIRNTSSLYGRKLLNPGLYFFATMSTMSSGPRLADCARFQLPDAPSTAHNLQALGEQGLHSSDQRVLRPSELLVRLEPALNGNDQL